MKRRAFLFAVSALPLARRDSRLERIGQFPPVLPAQPGREIRRGLIYVQSGKGIEQAQCFLRRRPVKAGKHFGARDDRDCRVAGAPGNIACRFGDAVEMVDEDDRIEQQLHLRLSHPRRDRF